eukprot:7377548-Prymnesium_polylepis.1
MAGGGTCIAAATAAAPICRAKHSAASSAVSNVPRCFSRPSTLHRALKRLWLRNTPWKPVAFDDGTKDRPSAAAASCAFFAASSGMIAGGAAAVFANTRRA